MKAHTAHIAHNMDTIVVLGQLVDEILIGRYVNKVSRSLGISVSQMEHTCGVYLLFAHRHKICQQIKKRSYPYVLCEALASHCRPDGATHSSGHVHCPKSGHPAVNQPIH